MINISIKNDFSITPFGMEKEDGENSGYFFRKKILLPALKKSNELIIIDLDADTGMGSSFIIGAFSLIVNELNPLTNSRYTFDEIKSRVLFVEFYPSKYSEIPNIWEYMLAIENEET